METDLNHVTLTGILERDPITRFADHGTQQVHFTLKLIEPGPAGQEFKLYVPVEAYSQVAAQAGDLNAGDAVLVAGKLKWTSSTAKDGTKKTSLAVFGAAGQSAGPGTRADRDQPLGHAPGLAPGAVPVRDVSSAQLPVANEKE